MPSLPRRAELPTANADFRRLAEGRSAIITRYCPISGRHRTRAAYSPRSLGCVWCALVFRRATPLFWSRFWLSFLSRHFLAALGRACALASCPDSQSTRVCRVPRRATLGWAPLGAGARGRSVSGVASRPLFHARAPQLMSRNKRRLPGDAPFLRRKEAVPRRRRYSRALFFFSRRAERTAL